MYATSPHQGELHRGGAACMGKFGIRNDSWNNFYKIFRHKKSMIYISSLIFDPSKVLQDFLYFLGTPILSEISEWLLRGCTLHLHLYCNFKVSSHLTLVFIYFNLPLFTQSAAKIFLSWYSRKQVVILFFSWSILYIAISNYI